MDDLIVIILTLVVAVFGIIGQTRKKKLTGEQPQTEKGPVNFWDMLESQVKPEQQFADDNEFFDDEPELVVENENIDVIAPTNMYRFDPKNEGKSTIREHEVLEAFKTKTKKANKEKFPLRKAVIYSEILKRKYI